MWKPIETAPKDGTEILACWVQEHGSMYFVAGAFWEQGCEETDGEPHWRDTYGEILADDILTHWMPLPEPPEASK